MLEELEDEEEGEYVNASYIDGYYSRVEFIATQHPLPNTKGDFWRMLLERSVNTLVVFGPLKDPEVGATPPGCTATHPNNMPCTYVDILTGHVTP